MAGYPGIEDERPLAHQALRAQRDLGMPGNEAMMRDLRSVASGW